MTTSGHDGSFTFAGLPAGRYTVSVDGDPTLELASWSQTEVTLGNTHACQEIFLPMTLLSMVDGYVLNADQQPVEDALVTLQETPVRSREADPRLDPSHEDSASTDATGRYEFKGVPPGCFTVSVGTDRVTTVETAFARGPDGQPEVAHLKLGGRHRFAPIMAVERPRTVLAGRIEFPDGRPAADIGVTAIRLHKGIRGADDDASAATDRDGHFELTILANQDYLLRTESATGTRSIHQFRAGTRPVTVTLRPQ